MANSVNVPPAVRDVLSRATITSDRVVLPPEQLERKLYEQVNKVLAAAGGKWNRKAAAHLFKHDPRKALGLAVDSGTIVNTKNVLQAFYTPLELADLLVEKVDLQPGERVLEPSCGGGALIAAVLRRQPAAIVHAIDIEEAAIFESAALVSSYQQAGIVPSGLQVKLVTVDFLEVEPSPIYDVVVMNPPFTKDQDIAHVRHAWAFLRPGGRLVSVMSKGWTWPGGSKKRQDWARFVGAQRGEVETVDAGAFKASGTMVETVIVLLRKP